MTNEPADMNGNAIARGSTEPSCLPTLEVRYEFAHRLPEDEVAQNLAHEGEGHAEHAQEEVGNCLQREGGYLNSRWRKQFGL